MVRHMVGYEYISKLGGNLRGTIKKAVKPLLKDGIGDTMDKGNLWIVPGFTLLAFAVLWTTKLSKIALDDATCKGASIYDFSGTPLDDDAQKHCATAKRYFVDINEPFSYSQKWREQRQVKNPEWALWFWAPIVFVMYVMTRFVWTLLMENQGINFNNVVNAAKSVQTDNDGVTEVDEEKLCDRLPVIADNFRCAAASHAVAAFLTFELALVIAPMFLLVVVLPLMIGSQYRSWGFDIARAWWEHKEWKGRPLQPLFGDNDDVHVPLIPRVTYCDYHFVSLGNDHVLTYRCYLDANWHERTALCTWALLVFLAFVNFCNLFFWCIWAWNMYNRRRRQKFVLNNWMNFEEIPPSDRQAAEAFAATFRMGNLLLFYFIEAHTDRVVASAFCTALFNRWRDQRRLSRSDLPGYIGIPMQNAEPPAGGLYTPPPKGDGPGRKIGWDLQSDALDAEIPLNSNVHPTAPPESIRSPSIAYSSATTQQMSDSGSRGSSARLLQRQPTKDSDDLRRVAASKSAAAQRTPARDSSPSDDQEVPQTPEQRRQEESRPLRSAEKSSSGTRLARQPSVESGEIELHSVPEEDDEDAWQPAGSNRQAAQQSNSASSSRKNSKKKSKSPPGDDWSTPVGKNGKK
ncbi:innexin inx-3 [Aphelenchoides avenae]|nr:innexin inx-3 [Aphelenchus avenae]